MNQAVQVWRDGRAGRIRLNRPKALNALDLAMVRQMHAAIEDFAADPAVHVVLVDAPERGFCAGGDVRSVRAAVLAGDPSAIDVFFRSEYALNQAIAELRKPYVALVDGICMGGGVGISVHGSHRIATEMAMFAMPETAIALFPDVGTSFLLPRLPGALGMYLGLTGARMMGADAVHAGLATHFVPRDALPALRAALPDDGVAAVAAHAQPLPPFSLAPHRAAIDRCFAGENMLDIVARLEAEGTDWAREVIATLVKLSPSALCWSLAAIRRGAGLSLHEALAAELRLTRHVTRHPDFAEGVRAMVVDKDRQPLWTPPSLKQVDPAAIAAMLE